jgi:hypothetical protein
MRREWNSLAALHSLQEDFPARVSKRIKVLGDFVKVRLGVCLSDRCQVPQLYCTVAAARCEAQPFGTLEEFQPSDLVDVAFKSMKQLARPGIPEFDSTIPPTRSDPVPVGAEGQREWPVAATDQRCPTVPCNIVDRGGVIAGDNAKARTVRTEGDQIRIIIALPIELA